MAGDEHGWYEARPAGLATWLWMTWGCPSAPVDPEARQRALERAWQEAPTDLWTRARDHEAAIVADQPCVVGTVFVSPEPLPPCRRSGLVDPSILAESVFRGEARPYRHDVVRLIAGFNFE